MFPLWGEEAALLKHMKVDEKSLLSGLPQKVHDLSLGPAATWVPSQSPYQG